jgi:hypothetical protein
VMYSLCDVYALTCCNDLQALLAATAFSVRTTAQCMCRDVVGHVCKKRQASAVCPDQVRHETLFFFMLSPEAIPVLKGTAVDGWPTVGEASGSTIT